MTSGEKRTVELIANTFGLYSGKFLEKNTHKESPWKDARTGYGDNVPSREVIPKESIAAYFKQIRSGYDVGTEQGLMRYIHDISQA